jgi:hypothetical protein
MKEAKMHTAERNAPAVPTTIAWNKVLADTIDVILFAPRLHVHRSHFLIALAGRLRPTASPGAVERFSGVELRGNPHGLTAQDLARGLRLGVRFADGRRATLERYAIGPAAGAPIELALSLSSSWASSDDGVFDWELAVTAIPEAGPVELYCQWLEMGIAESMAEIDGDALRDAAERSIRLWPAGDASTTFPGGISS